MNKKGFYQLKKKKKKKKKNMDCTSFWEVLVPPWEEFVPNWEVLVTCLKAVVPHCEGLVPHWERNCILCIKTVFLTGMFQVRTFTVCPSTSAETSRNLGNFEKQKKNPATFQFVW